MANSNTSFDTTVSTFTYANRKVKVKNLKDELTLSAAINEFRASNRLEATRNAYVWWKYVLVVLAQRDVPTNFSQVIEILARHNIRINNQTSILYAAVAGAAPDRIRREYRKSLPVMVNLLGLTASRSEYQWTIDYKFKDNKKAKQNLIALYPETELLFELLKS